jgi:hypothetical protein
LCALVVVSEELRVLVPEELWVPVPVPEEFWVPVPVPEEFWVPVPEKV